ncbi:response regulator transcription factor [Flavitalea sp. BT771]|uniref:response regulator transcription factor n=1 Tax=Flavitalea sp. BT771 TaxID=3063329 RepID=UPI0026E1C6D6|nr:response regulator transcription factor [Flavitalea sp. BT771]MDO6432519.1 response regulator transcription factor [Flavitalea sp. BT771]MDV6221428.1 response regulator transcription factor [Flavitalea sp. BT771]
MKILIVEDEQELMKSMATYLKSENFVCEEAPDYKTAREKIELFSYDCILLDVSLPDGNGLSLLNELKENKKSDGVIVISAKNSIGDRIQGLNLGADDYLTKPFHLSELNARILAVIRRRHFQGQQILIFNELTIDLTAKTVTVHRCTVELTRKEYDLLLYLAYNKNRVISKNAIAEHLSGDESDIYSNYDFIYSHMKNLKKKLQQAGCSEYIRSIYGMGYKFDV